MRKFKDNNYYKFIPDPNIILTIPLYDIKTQISKELGTQRLTNSVSEDDDSSQILFFQQTQKARKRTLPTSTSDALQRNKNIRNIRRLKTQRSKISRIKKRIIARPDRRLTRQYGKTYLPRYSVWSYAVSGQATSCLQDK